MSDLVKFLEDMADDAMGMEPEDRLILGECAARINELEAIENGLDDRITVLEDYITKLKTTARQNKERHALKSMN